MKRHEYRTVDRVDLGALNRLGAEGWIPASSLTMSWITIQKALGYGMEHQVWSGLMMRPIEEPPATDAATE